MSDGRVLRVFLKSDLRCGHEGLGALARKNKINVDTLLPGEYLLFINNAKNKLKLFASNKVLAYLRLDKGHLDMKTIQLIPQAFHGGVINYEEALRAVLERALKPS